MFPLILIMCVKRMSCHIIRHNVPGLRLILFLLREYRGVGGGGNGDNREDTSNLSYRKQPLIVVESLDVPPEHANILPAALILPKCRVDNALFVSLYSLVAKFQSGWYRMTAGTNLIG